MSRIFIGNLPFTFSNEELAKFASDNGVKCQSAEVSTRGARSLGFGYVILPNEDADAAAKAVEALNNKDAAGRKARAEVARPMGTRAPRTERAERPAGAADTEAAPRRARAPRTMHDQIPAPTTGTTLHVGNLPYAATDDDLKNVFDGCKTKSTKVAMRGARSLGFGFVEFATADDAKKAKELVEGTQVEGRTIKIEFARAPATERRPVRRVPLGAASGAAATGAPMMDRKPRSPRKPRVPLSDRVKSKTTVHIGKLSFSATEEDLKAALAKFKPKSVKIVTRPDGKSKGFAFVEFETEDQAKAALAINDVDIKGMKVQADIAFVQIAVEKTVAPSTTVTTATKQ